MEVLSVTFGAWLFSMTSIQRMFYILFDLTLWTGSTRNSTTTG
jgi:hypothetical protein